MKLLHVQDNSLIKGYKYNNWGSVIGNFIKQMDQYLVADTLDSLSNDFSSTSVIDQTASKVSVISMKHYFTYSSATTCGLPQINLAGNKGDWIHLRKKAEILQNNQLDGFGERGNSRCCSY